MLPPPLNNAKIRCEVSDCWEKKSVCDYIIELEDRRLVHWQLQSTGKDQGERCLCRCCYLVAFGSFGSDSEKSLFSSLEW